MKQFIVVKFYKHSNLKFANIGIYSTVGSKQKHINQPTENL